MQPADAARRVMIKMANPNDIDSPTSTNVKFTAKKPSGAPVILRIVERGARLFMAGVLDR